MAAFRLAHTDEFEIIHALGSMIVNHFLTGKDTHRQKGKLKEQLFKIYIYIYKLYFYLLFRNRHVNVYAFFL